MKQTGRTIVRRVIASWMVHLRIADASLDKIAGIDELAFVMGNIAPDSGVPNADWTGYTPPKSVSHYYAAQEDGKSKKIDADAFCAAYFSEEDIASYSAKAYSFFLGYFVHLLTDIEQADCFVKETVDLLFSRIADSYTRYISFCRVDITDQAARTHRRPGCIVWCCVFAYYIYWNRSPAETKVIGSSSPTMGRSHSGAQRIPASSCTKWPGMIMPTA